MSGATVAVTRRGGAGLALEALLWLAVVALMSPLVIYAGRPAMPLAALVAIAAGIAGALALAGRQLHGVLLADGLAGRKSTAKLLIAAGMTLLVVLLVLLGAVVALLLLFRGSGIGTALQPGLGG